MNDWNEFHQALDAMIASGGVEVHEDGEWLAEFAQFRWEFRGRGANFLIHLWSDGRNLTRRIVGLKEHSPGRIVLEVQRFGRPKPGRLEFLHPEGQRPAARVSREQFRARIERIFSECFPDAKFSVFSTAPDLKRSFSARYARGLMQDGSGDWAVLAVPPDENSSNVEASLAFGILWLDAVRSRGERRAVRGLRIFVPEGTGRILRERVLGLSGSAQTELFEFCERERRVQKMDPADAGNLESWLAPHSQMESLLAAARESAERVPALGAAGRESSEAIRQRVLPGGQQAAFAFRGLEFARWSLEGFSFGLDDSRRRLDKSSEPAFARLLAQLNLYRNSLASETKHPLYRKAPERWLETLILEDPTKLDAQLHPGFLYSQMPALTSGDRGVIDLLGVTRRGQLVIVELKASEDIQLPIQAVDYWLRVRRHQREGNFERYGYFPGVQLDPRPPLVWLAAPSLQFHSTSDILLRYLSPEIKFTRVGLNENWRRGLSIVFRQ
jgi:hypothetical protein